MLQISAIPTNLYFIFIFFIPLHIRLFNKCPVWGNVFLFVMQHHENAQVKILVITAPLIVLHDNAKITTQTGKRMNFFGV